MPHAPSPHSFIVRLLLSNYGHWFSLSSQHTSAWQLAIVSGLTGLLTAELCGHTICLKAWPIYSLFFIQLFDRSTTHPVCFFICNQHFCLFLYLFLHHLPKFKLTFSSIPTITSHLHPITSNDNACQGKLFRDASPSALHFSIKLPHWLICLTVQGYNSSLHSLAMLLSSTDTAFCFIQAIFFLNWQRAPREVESESDHITQTCFCVEAGSRQPQALHLKICKKKVSGRSLGDGVVVLACSPSTLYMFSYFTEMHVGLIFSVQ